MVHRNSMQTYLNIRNFLKGEDEEVWLSIGNEAFQEFEDYRIATIEDMSVW